ncbi:response regulator [Paenibacillus macerans]|uniref:Response regulator n=1 Tax=Paenibacillus macerans TaxID=44252 RepID=A0A6N8EM73_PAEMA|nr:response regulator transcription factor [Paenibacillus macerans]MED4955864.1 response regulator transcription factor [Paenibacillus macerans]MUG21396.1 response regulator [Paenibacillus macerans]OMG51260.1 DNA-binding response regulator [Paenibacillus macerans]
MSKLQVLVVDDEWNMRNLLRIYLTREGFEVKEAANGYEALGMAEKHRFDVILLDIMLPDMDGWQVCKKIRENDNVAILMLTARSETKDKVHGLGIGADDYLTKPFEQEELLARVYALIRRAAMTETAIKPEPVLEFGHLRILPEGREVYIHDTPVEFTLKEFDLLLTLAKNGQRAFGREQLVNLIWGSEYEGEVRVVDTHIKNIRDKTQKAGLGFNPVQTVWGVGYKWNGAGSSQ